MSNDPFAAMVASSSQTAVFCHQKHCWKPQYLLNTTKDLTHRKQAEADLLSVKEAMAATKGRSDFLANTSHEIRTPMNAILGITYLALKTDLTAKQRDYLSKNEVAGQDLAHEIYNRVFRNVPERLMNK